MRIYTDGKREGSDQRTDKTPPHSLDTEYVAHFLWGTFGKNIPRCGQRREVTSIENNTPPIGEPKATATPAADAAVMTSLILPEAGVNTSDESKMSCHELELREKRRDHPATRDPIQHATCTEGPSFPTDKPEAMTKGCT